MLACDGLWDTLDEETVTQQIYAHLTASNGYSSAGVGSNGSYSARPVSAYASSSSGGSSSSPSPAVVLRGGRAPSASGFVSGPSLSGQSDDAFSHLAERLVFLARDKGSQDSTHYEYEYLWIQALYVLSCQQVAQSSTCLSEFSLAFER